MPKPIQSPPRGPDPCLGKAELRVLHCQGCQRRKPWWWFSASWFYLGLVLSAVMFDCLADRQREQLHRQTRELENVKAQRESLLDKLIEVSEALQDGEARFSRFSEALQDGPAPRFDPRLKTRVSRNGKVLGYVHTEEEAWELIEREIEAEQCSPE